MYSVIPVGSADCSPENLRWAMVFFPLVGIAEGGLVWFWHLIAQKTGISAFFFATLAVFLAQAISGGIHLDGFCDSLDAIASHREPAEQLRIMKDPHIGPFAVFGVVFLLLTQTAFYTELYTLESWRFWLALLLCMMLQRCLSARLIVSLPSARSDGLAATFAAPADAAVRRILSSAAGLLAGVVLLLQAWRGVAVVAVTGLWYLYYKSFVLKRYGGITGDLAGLFLIVTEWMTLFVFAISAGGGMK